MTQVQRQQATRNKDNTPGTLLEFLIILVVTFALVFGVVRPFIAEVFYIPTESMVPTLEVGDRVLVSKLIYLFSGPQRGDVIVFESPDEDIDLVKRVVGVPGDNVKVVRGSLYVNGERWEEAYLNYELPDKESAYGPITVPEGHIFVMGDNRADSADSRYIGPVPLDYLVGKAFVRIWPLEQVGFL
jgi:signal peptidase I